MESNGTREPEPDDFNVWLQTPLHFLLAIGEILGLVALNEYTYSEAPTNMKAVVQALQEIAAAMGAALGIALGPVSRDPWLVVMYASLAGTMALSSAVFIAFFKKYDAIYDSRDAKAAGDVQGEEKTGETPDDGKTRNQ